MKIRVLRDFDRAKDFLNGNFSAPTHWPEWNMLVSKYFKTDFYYYGAYEKADLIGICPIHEVKNGILSCLYSGQFHFIPNGGWIFSKKSLISDKDIRLDVLTAFRSFTLPIIDEFNVTYNLKRKGIMKTLIIDLHNSLDSIWKDDLDPKRRNMIRKAEKNGLVVQIRNDQIPCFYPFYRKANLRNHLPSLPEDFFYELLSSTYANHFDTLWAKKDDEPFAIALVAYDKNYAFYWLGVRIDNKANLGQGELLQWEAIKETKKRGCKYYDLCYIDKECLPHIYEFKKGFSRTEADIVLLSKKSFSYRVADKLRKWS
jgi:hypothetical protein